MAAPPCARAPRVLVGACGSVAAVKVPELVARLAQAGCEVRVVWTEHARHFLGVAAGYDAAHHAAYEQLLRARSVVAYEDADEWRDYQRVKDDPVVHIELRKWADVLVLAPLSANTLGKLACGLCDNLLSSVVRAWDPAKPLLLAPAMNTLMWQHPLTAEQLRKARELMGAHVVEPAVKVLACGDAGSGALAPVSEIFAAVLRSVGFVSQDGTPEAAPAPRAAPAPAPGRVPAAPVMVPGQGAAPNVLGAARAVAAPATRAQPRAAFLTRPVQFEDRARLEELLRRQEPGERGKGPSAQGCLVLWWRPFLGAPLAEVLPTHVAEDRATKVVVAFRAMMDGRRFLCGDAAALEPDADDATDPLRGGPGPGRKRSIGHEPHEQGEGEEALRQPAEPGAASPKRTRRDPDAVPRQPA
jgi:phosphopantothenoylcysteine decarboxylase